MAFTAKFNQFFRNIGQYFRESWVELKKVRWPNRKELISYTTVVVVTVTLVAIYFGLLDSIFTNIIKLILG